MDNFKSWYKERKGKYILFFGFYFFFFIFLAIYMRAINNDKKNNPSKEEAVEKEKITTYSITNLISNDYNYEIVINDNEEIINYSGSKSNIDYANFSNRYFLDFYNINQLLKRSKFIDSKDYVLTYELSNKEINELLLTTKKDGKNKIEVYVNDDTEIERIVFDLSSYLEKDIYQIDIVYTIGENNENSSS